MGSTPLQASAARWFGSLKEDVGNVRKGMILQLGPQYIEVKEWQPTKSGRGAQAFNISYEDLETGKSQSTKFTSGTKLPKVEPVKTECQVMYLTGGGTEERRVVLADEDYNEIELPLSRFYANPNLTEGSKVLLYKDEDAIVKVSVLKVGGQ